MIGYSSSMHYQQAQDILKQNNPNDLTISGGWFKDLPKDKFRYVPYNGIQTHTHAYTYMQILLYIFAHIFIHILVCG